MADASNQRTIELFRVQFAPDGDGYLYRRGRKGAAIRVSSGEYQEFVDTFARASRRLRWGFAGGIFLIILVDSIWSVSTGVDVDSPAGSIVLIGLILIAAIAFVWLFNRSYHRPAQILERRVPVSGELSREEFRRQWFGSMRWTTILGRLGSLLVVSVVILLDHDVMHGWGRLWLLLLGFFALIAVLLVWRKLSYTVPAP